MWITFYFCGKVWCNVDNFVDRMWITFLKCWKTNKPTNKLNTHIGILVLVRPLGRQSQYLFYPRQVNFYPKNILHFWTMCNFQKPFITRGYFTFPKNPPWLPEGECVPLSPTTQFSTSRSPPKFPLKIPQNHSRTTSTHLRKVLYFQPFPTS